jgi:hypothetical protein
VFRETGSVTHKKGAGRPIVRTEEIATRNKLRRTFSTRYTNELDTTFFCSTSPLKAPNRLKSLKFA